MRGRRPRERRAKWGQAPASLWITLQTKNAAGESRTLKSLRSQRPERCASANFATAAKLSYIPICNIIKAIGSGDA